MSVTWICMTCSAEVDLLREPVPVHCPWCGEANARVSDRSGEPGGASPRTRNEERGGVITETPQ